MNDDDLIRHREALERLRADLESVEASAREATRPVVLDQAAVGRLSRMDAIQGQQMAHEAERRRRRQLVAIDGALRRIESGDFGWCFVCGEPIGPRRLAADPTTTRCIDCAEGAGGTKPGGTK